MLLDSALEFFSNKAITADAYGDVYIPLGTTASQVNSGGGAGAVGGPIAAAIGKGEPLFAYARVGTAFAACDGITIKIVAADDNAGTNAVVLLEKTILVAALTLNSFHALGMLSGAGSGKVISCQCVVNGADDQTGTLTVGLVADRDGLPQNDVFSAS